MSNAVDYIKWRGDLSFEAAPINEIDLFLFSQVCMVNYEDLVPDDESGVPLSKVAQGYFKTHDTDVKKNIGVLQAMSCLEAFKLMGESARFGNVLVGGYVNNVNDANEEQFSATTFRLSPNVLVVAFRGTDDTIIGWKEDCNLAIYDEVPAQRAALNYLRRTAETHKGKIVVVGHSKGGNLAVYAAMNSTKKIKDRILRVLNFDGPGLRKNIIAGESYMEIKDKITTVLSENAMIGTLLEMPGTPVIVRTEAEGLIAHDGFKWDVETNHFVRVKRLSKFSRAFDNAFEKAMASMSEEDMQSFVEELFGILFSTGAETLTDIHQSSMAQKLQAANQTINNKAVRDFTTMVLRAFVRA